MNKKLKITPISVNTGEPGITAETVESLHLVPQADECLYAHSLPQVFDHVYGGQLISQGIMAAAATVSGERQNLVNAAHVQFLRAGELIGKIAYYPAVLTDGRSFSTRLVTAFQKERQLLQMTVSFQSAQPGPEHSPSMPMVDAPTAYDSSLEFFAKAGNKIGDFLAETSAFDLRHVTGNVYTKVAPPRDIPHLVWFRPRSPIAQNSQITHRALLAYATDEMMMEPLLKRQGLHWQVPGLALASLDHSIWFHNQVDINQWHLFVGTSSAASGSRGLQEATIYAESGTIVASITQQAMIRLPKENEDPGRWAFDGRGLK